MITTAISPKYEATVVISTLNRKDDLRRALQSVVSQTIPVEIIVIDDGSTDGTFEMVTKEFTQVKVYRSEKSQGLTVQRNMAAQYATTKIIISIDDDGEFSSPNVVAQTITEFSHPSVGAVSIPMIDTYRNAKYGMLLPNNEDVFVTHLFIGCAYAVRVDIFKSLNGFREFLWGWGEEEDYCLRLLEAGYVIRCGRADHVYHHVSQKRNLRNIAYYSSRNSIIYTFANVPMPFFIIHLAGTTLVNIYGSIRRGFFGACIKGLLRGYIDSITGPITRAPVSIKAYTLSRRIREHGVIAISSALDHLVKH